MLKETDITNKHVVERDCYYINLNYKGLGCIHFTNKNVLSKVAYNCVVAELDIIPEIMVLS